jgi:hypothetical protein
MLSGKKRSGYSTTSSSKKPQKTAAEKAKEQELKAAKKAEMDAKRAAKKAAKKAKQVAKSVQKAKTIARKSTVKSAKNIAKSKKHKGCTTEKCWALLETQQIRKSLKKQREQIHEQHEKKQKKLKARYEELYKEYPSLIPKKSKAAKPKISAPIEMGNCIPGADFCYMQTTKYANGNAKVVSWNLAKKPKKLPKGLQPIGSKANLNDGCGCKIY